MSPESLLLLFSHVSFLAETSPATSSTTLLRWAQTVLPLHVTAHTLLHRFRSPGIKKFCYYQKRPSQISIQFACSCTPVHYFHKCNSNGRAASHQKPSLGNFTSPVTSGTTKDDLSSELLITYCMEKMRSLARCNTQYSYSPQAK